MMTRQQGLVWSLTSTSQPSPAPGTEQALSNFALEHFACSGHHGGTRILSSLPTFALWYGISLQSLFFSVGLSPAGKKTVVSGELMAFMMTRDDCLVVTTLCPPLAHCLWLTCDQQNTVEATECYF